MEFLIAHPAAGNEGCIFDLIFCSEEIIIDRLDESNKFQIGTIENIIVPLRDELRRKRFAVCQIFHESVFIHERLLPRREYFPIISCIFRHETKKSERK